MDVESLDTLKAAISTLEASLDEVVGRAGTALNGEFNSTITQLSNIIHGVLIGLQAIADKATSDLQIANLLQESAAWRAEAAAWRTLLSSGIKFGATMEKA
jgi:hypothetical protein